MFRFPILRESNNGTLSGMKVMPQKDLTSDGDSSFAMARKEYVRSLDTTPDSATYNNVTNSLSKKWYGNTSSRDSSRVMSHRVRNEVGNGTLNASKNAFSFTAVKDNNTVRQALTRVRNKGSTVPNIKTHNYENAPVF